MRKIVDILVLISIFVLSVLTAVYADTADVDYYKVFEQHGLSMLMINLETNTFVLALTCLLLLMFLTSILLLNTSRKLKAQNLEIKNFDESRRTFIDADDSAIFLKDESLKYVFVNKAFENFNNMKASDVVGHDDFDLIDKESAALYRKIDLEVLEKKAIVVNEIKRKNKVFLTTKFPVKLNNGHHGVGANVRDVTEEYNNKIKAEKTLYRNSILVNVMNRSYESAQEQLDYVLHEVLKLTESKFGYIYMYTMKISKNSHSTPGPKM